ncbi:MAG: MerR family transcriptional regulator [Phascolarctobacterium sp.]|nr:MerR family transcriptional regulator [Phascolarctobacterium sp.]
MGLSIKQVSERYGISADTIRYYEKVGVIPPINRNASGVRDFNQQDISWVEHAKCMRSAGLAVDGLIRYLELYQQGSSTFQERLELLTEQRNELVAQYKQLDETIARLNYKISCYEEAVRTGELVWERKAD